MDENAMRRRHSFARRSLQIAAVSAGLAAGLLLAPATPALAFCPAPSGDAYSTAVLADSPIAYYRLGEPAGNTMCDASTSANNGTYNSSGITYGVAGAVGGTDTAISANGTAGVVGNSTANAGITGNHSFTFEAWFRSTGTNQNQALVHFGQAGNGQVAGLTTWRTPCGFASMSCLGLDEYASGNGWDTSTVGVNMYDGNWHYLVVTYDAVADQAVGYADAQSLGAQTPSTSSHMFNLLASPVGVGNWVDTSLNQPFNGALDEVAVYPTALSAARIVAHYQAGGYQLTPQSTSPPTISGSPVDGLTLTESHGGWSNSPNSFAYQWQDCDGAGANCAPIAGANAQTYTLTGSDVGHTVRVLETASNGAGAGPAAPSAATATVTAPRLTVARAGSGTGAVSGSGIACPSTCAASYASGTVVTLVASAASGSVFSGWSGGGCSGTGGCQLTIRSDTTVTATFTPAPPPPATPIPPAAPSCTLSSTGVVQIAHPKKHKGHSKAAAATGTLPVEVRCDQAARVQLDAVLTDVTKTKSGHHSKTKTKHHQLPTVNASVNAGTAATLKLKLPASVVSDLERHARQSVSLTLLATNSNGTGRATGHVSPLRT